MERIVHSTFDNVPSGNADGPLMNIQQEGGARLQFRLNAVLAHVVTIVIFGEFENVMEITKEGGVLYNAFGS